MDQCKKHLHDEEQSCSPGQNSEAASDGGGHQIQGVEPGPAWAWPSIAFASANAKLHPPYPPKLTISFDAEQSQDSSGPPNSQNLKLSSLQISPSTRCARGLLDSAYQPQQPKKADEPCQTQHLGKEMAPNEIAFFL